MLVGIEPRPYGYKSDALPNSFLYHLCLKQSQVLSVAMCDWFCQIDLVELIWQKKVELRKSLIAWDKGACLLTTETRFYAIASNDLKWWLHWRQLVTKR